VSLNVLRSALTATAETKTIAQKILLEGDIAENFGDSIRCMILLKMEFFYLWIAVTA
jgi:hypothetical protein